MLREKVNTWSTVRTSGKNKEGKGKDLDKQNNLSQIANQVDVE